MDELEIFNNLHLYCNIGRDRQVRFVNFLGEIENLLFEEKGI